MSNVFGRNKCWADNSAEHSRKLFFKQFIGLNAGLRYTKCKTIGSATNRSGHSFTPELVFEDDIHLILGFEFIDGETMYDLMLSKKLSVSDAKAIGRGLSEFHSDSSEIAEELALQPSLFTPTRRFLENPLFQELAQVSNANLQLIRAVQKDKFLLEALDLRQECEHFVPTHQDMRGNQIILDSAKNLYVLDFEEMALGYVEGDVGALLGELYMRSIMDVWTDRIESGDFDGSMGPNTQANRFSEAKSYYAPLAKAIFSEYCAIYGHDLNTSTVTVEILRFILNRLISTNMWRSSMSPRSRALFNGVIYLSRNRDLIKEFFQGD